MYTSFYFIFAEEVTRNYIENASDPAVYQSKLLPWQPCDHKQIDHTQQEPDVSYFVVNKKYESIHK